MNNQEAFKTAVQHLRKQGEKSRSEICGHTQCVYRGEHGLKCAIGCLIPDDLYTPELEGKNIGRVLDGSFQKITWFLSGASLDLLRALQTAHDQYPVDNWEDAFLQIATEFNLTLPEKV